MDFPRHLHKPEGRYVEVKDQDQYDAAKDAGWADLPEAHVEQPVEVPFAQALNNVVIDFDAAAEPEKKKPGRKPKGSVN